MNQTPPSATQLDNIRKMSSMLRHFVWPGAFAVFLSFFENSPFWTIFIVLTAWIGVVMGLTGGPGFADHLLKKGPSLRQLSQGMATIFSLGTFWIPTLATGAFAMALTGALREDLRPQSYIDDNFMNYMLLILQVFAMYFLAAGVSWSIVGRELNRVQQELESSEN